MIPLSELKAALRLDSDAEDTFLVALESAAVAYLQKGTGRYFGPVGLTTERLDAHGGRDLYLSEPVASGVPSVSVDGVAVPSDQFTVYGRRLRRVSGEWGTPFSPLGEIEVEYTRGYASTGTGAETSVAAPEDIRQAVRLLVTHWFENRVPVVTGASVAEAPHTVAEIIAKNRRYSL